MDAIDQDNTTTQPLEQVVPGDAAAPATEAPTTPLQQLVQQAPFGPRAKWLIGLIITVAGTAAYPLAAGFSTYMDKRAVRNTETARRNATALVSQRTMQADLLKRVISVAERATLKDPASIFQLGLIAEMVDKNYDKFGLTLQDAAQTMRRMFESLAPVSGLRRRLAESDWLLRWLRQRRDRAEQQQQKIQQHVTEIQRSAAKTQLPWRRQQLLTALQDYQNHLLQRQTEQLFYDQQVKREEAIRQYFADALQRQEDLLKRRLQQTTQLRNRLQQRTQRFSYLVTELKLQAKVPRATAAELRTIMVEVEADNESAQQTIIRLQAELQSEHDAHDTTKRLLQRAQTDLRWYRANLVIPVPQACPTPKATPKSKPAPKRAIRKARVRKYTPLRRSKRSTDFGRLQHLYRD